MVGCQGRIPLLVTIAFIYYGTLLSKLTLDFIMIFNSNSSTDYRSKEPSLIWTEHFCRSVRDRIPSISAKRIVINTFQIRELIKKSTRMLTSVTFGLA